jgi:hypothetical protein
MASCFYNRGSHEACRTYGDKWVANLEQIESSRHFDYFKQYVIRLSPAFLGLQSHADAMKALLAKHQGNVAKSYLCRCLKEEIYTIETVQKIKNRECA